MKTKAKQNKIKQNLPYSFYFVSFKSSYLNFLKTEPDTVHSNIVDLPYTSQTEIY